MAKYQSQGSVGKACPICGGMFALIELCVWNASNANCVVSSIQVLVIPLRIVQSSRKRRDDRLQVILEREPGAIRLFSSYIRCSRIIGVDEL